jgi:hypothetical protein
MLDHIATELAAEYVRLMERAAEGEAQLDADDECDLEGGRSE